MIYTGNNMILRVTSTHIDHLVPIWSQSTREEAWLRDGIRGGTKFDCSSFAGRKIAGKKKFTISVKVLQMLKK